MTDNMMIGIQSMIAGLSIREIKMIYFIFSHTLMYQ